MIKFRYTILYVKNVTESITFYEQIFDFKRKFITPENDYGELNTGETTIAFASLELAKSNIKNGIIESELTNKPFGIELGFISDDVNETYSKAINYGAISEMKPIEKPWGQIVSYIRDIDGFLIEICSPLD